MSGQRINLYQDELKEVRVILPARQMLALLVLAVIAAAGASFWVRSLPDTPRAQADALQEQAGLREEAVKTLQERVDRLAPNEVLIRQRDALKRRLDGMQRLRQAVIPPPEAALFSWFLEGLGRRAIDGIWLTRIHIGSMGKSFLLRGGAIDPALIPAYLQALQTEPVYTGLAFDELTISRQSPDSPHLSFSISTRCLPDEKCQ